MRNFLVLLALFCLTGCSSHPLWSLSVLNVTDTPIKLKTEKNNSTEILAQRALEDFSLKFGETLKVLQDGKVIEEYPVGTAPLQFAPEKDGKILLVVGGPAEFAIADYTDFYTTEGKEPKANPEIKFVANLRDKQSVLLQRGDKLAWPHHPLALTRPDGGGFKDLRFLRVVPISVEIEDDKLMEYLNSEFDAKREETKS